MPLLITHAFRCVEADTVAPKVRNVANLVLELVHGGVSGHEVCIVDELEEELVEVGLDIHALQSWVVVLVDQDVVGVDFKAAIFASHYPDMVILVRLPIRLDDVIVLD